MLSRKMLPRSSPDGIHIAFDDHRLVDNAGLILPATLAQHLGLPQLVQQRLDLGNAPGRANHGRQGDDRWWRQRWLAATALTTPMRCAPVGLPAPWAAWSRRHPPWVPSLYLGGAGTRQTVPS